MDDGDGAEAGPGQVQIQAGGVGMRQSLRSSINAFLDAVGVQARPARGRLPSKAWPLSTPGHAKGSSPLHSHVSHHVLRFTSWRRIRASPPAGPCRCHGGPSGVRVTSLACPGQHEIVEGRARGPRTEGGKAPPPARCGRFGARHAPGPGAHAVTAGAIERGTQSALCGRNGAGWGRRRSGGAGHPLSAGGSALCPP